MSQQNSNNKSIKNEEGQLDYRVATYRSLAEAMTKRLGQVRIEADENVHDPLRGLTTRKPSDPSLAMLDAWAVVGDILSFYQERIANEGFLSTATERRLIVELGRLVGYAPRPGVAASVQLAFSLEEGSGEITIPAGTGVKSVPGQGEKAQAFETKHDIIARPEWNEIKPRQFQPQNITLENITSLSRLYVKGISTNLKPNDYLVFDFGSAGAYQYRRIKSVETNPEQQVTTLVLLTDEFSSKSLVDAIEEAIVRAKTSALKAFQFLELPQEVRDTIGLLLTHNSGTEGSLSLVIENGLALNDANLDLWSSDVQSASINLEGAVFYQVADETLETQNSNFSALVMLQNERLAETVNKFWTALNEEDQTNYEKLIEDLQELEQVVPSPPWADLVPIVVKIRDDFKTGLTDSYLKSLSQDILKSINEDPESTFAAESDYINSLIELLDGANGLISLLTGLAKEARNIIIPFHIFEGKLTKHMEKFEGGHLLNKVLADIENVLSISTTEIESTRDQLAEKVGLLIQLDIPTPQSTFAPNEVIDLIKNYNSEIVDLQELALDADSASEFLAKVVDLQLDQSAITAPQIPIKKLNGGYNAFQRDLQDLALNSVDNRDSFRQNFSKSVALILTKYSEQLVRFVDESKAKELIDDARKDLDGKEPIASTVKKLESLIDKDQTDSLSQIQEALKDEEHKKILGFLIGELESEIQKTGKVEGVVEPSLNDAIGGAIENLTATEIKQSELELDSVNVAFGKSDGRTPDTYGKILSAISPNDQSLFDRWKGLRPRPVNLGVYALRMRAPLFGYNAPGIAKSNGGQVEPINTWDDEWEFDPNIETDSNLFLDRDYEEVVSGSLLIIESEVEVSDKDGGSEKRLERKSDVYKVMKTNLESRTAYGLSGKTTRLEIQGVWRSVSSEEKIGGLRKTLVFANSEKLELAYEPIEKIVGDIEGSNEIELGGFYDGLESGRKLIISGEVAERYKIEESEVVEVLGVNHVWRKISGETPHTILILKKNLSREYVRNTTTIYANTVLATHGETRQEVIGSGDAGRSFQSFELSTSPLTFIAAPTARGSASTLSVTVAGIRWNEQPSLVGVGPDERVFITSTDNEQVTSVKFGDGNSGTRLPTGIENVLAEYRAGIGGAGNVKKHQISQLASQPLGVKGVINPLPATGGAGPETRNQARKNLPLSLVALDRLVSVDDYESFARTFAGIGKASARMLRDGQRKILHLTLAGIDDNPIDLDSELIRNLMESLRRFGDPRQSVQLAVRDQLLLIVGAKIKTVQDYLWEPVESQIREKLLAKFGFENREFGEGVYSSDVITTIQNVEGVAYVELDVFQVVDGSFPTGFDPGKVASFIPAKLAGNDRSEPTDPTTNGILAAQIIFISPKVPETLLLREIAQ